MRIYGLFESFYPDDICDLTLVKISSKPFTKGICRYLDFEENKQYECYTDMGGELEDWKMYNGEIRIGNFLYNPKTKEYINSRIVEGCVGIYENWVELEDGRHFNEDGYDGEYSTYAGGYESAWTMFQKYKNGKLIETRFEVE